MDLITLALTFFIVLNPVAQAPFFVSLVNHLDHKRQQQILKREILFALAIAYFFIFVGEIFLDALQVSPSTVRLCGGFILIFVAIDLIFPHGGLTRGAEEGTEPFLVPIAIPLLSGPSLMTTVMLFSKTEPSTLKLCAAVGLAYAAGAIAILGMPYAIQRLGKRGLSALEQLLGMLLMLIAIEMFTSGLNFFVQELN